MEEQPDWLTERIPDLKRNPESGQPPADPNPAFAVGVHSARRCSAVRHCDGGPPAALPQQPITPRVRTSFTLLPIR